MQRCASIFRGFLPFLDFVRAITSSLFVGMDKLLNNAYIGRYVRTCAAEVETGELQHAEAVGN